MQTERTTVDPTELIVSECNERQTNVEADDELVESVSNGWNARESPLVRPCEQDGVEYEVVCGQRRVDAACKAELDEITVDVKDLTDLEARVESTKENRQGQMNKNVSIHDRSLNLWELWQDMGGDGFPSKTKLSNRLGEAHENVGRWIEPLREEWRGTGVDPRSNVDGLQLDDIGERTLMEVRRISNTPTEQKLRLIRRVGNNQETRRTVKDIRDTVEDGVDLRVILDHKENDEPVPEPDTTDTSVDDTDSESVQDTDVDSEPSSNAENDSSGSDTTVDRERSSSSSEADQSGVRDGSESHTTTTDDVDKSSFNIDANDDEDDGGVSSGRGNGRGDGTTEHVEAERLSDDGPFTKGGRKRDEQIGHLTEYVTDRIAVDKYGVPNHVPDTTESLWERMVLLGRVANANDELENDSFTHGSGKPPREVYESAVADYRDSIAESGNDIPTESWEMEVVEQ